MQLIRGCLKLIPLEMAEINLGQLRIVPVDQHVLRVFMSGGGRIIETAEFNGLPVCDNHFIVVDLIDADYAHITTGIRQG